MKDIVFITNPNLKDIQDIKLWCESFNFSDVENAFSRKKLFVVRIQDKTIAFLCYRHYEIVATIILAEVHPGYRNRQVGGYMLESALQHFKQTGVKVAELYYTSDGSRRHAKRHGFKPITKEHDNREWMYRPLIDTRKPCKKSKLMFAVWKNTMGFYDKKPDVCWALDKELQKPILAYCFYDWMVGVIENGIVVNANVFKRFFRERDYEYIYIVGDKVND